MIKPPELGRYLSLLRSGTVPRLSPRVHIARLQRLHTHGEQESEPAIFRAIVDGCNRVLADPAVSQRHCDRAALHVLRANALRRLGFLCDDAAPLEQSIAGFAEALRLQARARSPRRWAVTRGRQCSAQASLGRMTGKPEVVMSALAGFDEALATLKRATTAKDWAAVHLNRANALSYLGERYRDAQHLRQAIAGYRAALEVYGRQQARQDWALTQINLGNALQRLGAMIGDWAALKQAAAAYRAVLTVHTRERSPTLWAMVQNHLGNALTRCGELAVDRRTLAQATAAYRAALEVRTRESAPLDWAATQTNLGNALALRGGLLGSRAVLSKAIAAYQAALTVRTRDRAPMNWAMTQDQLGTALRRLGELTADSTLLTQAVAAHRMALEERTRKRALAEWAATQNSLGLALQALAELTGDRARLDDAIAAFRMALRHYTRRTAPLDWALARTHLGNALQTLAELTGESIPVGHAVAAYRAALGVYPREQVPMLWTAAKNNLGNALQSWANLTQREELLAEAADAYREVLQVRARARAPMDWAATQHNLGDALARRGALIGDRALLVDAVAAYGAALHVRTSARAPLDWAITQAARGAALESLGRLTEDPSVLMKAVAAFRAAMKVMDSTSAEDYRQGTAAGLSNLLVALRRYDEAVDVIESALVLSDAAILDSARSRHARARAVERVGELYSLLSLCRLRQQPCPIAAALVAAEAGRARLLTDALALDDTRLAELDDDKRREILAARRRCDALRQRLGVPWGSSDAGSRAGAALAETVSRRLPLPARRTALEADLQRATETHLAICRKHGLVPTPAPVSAAQILAAVPPCGALVLPVLTEDAGFALVATASAGLAVIDLPALNRCTLKAKLSGAENWLGAYQQSVGRGDFARQIDGNASQTNPLYRNWNVRLACIQGWLWQVLLCPVDRHLRCVAKLGQHAPVVLLPTGWLGTLPLHAAGPGPDGQNFCDHWTVSLTPSVRALLACRRRLPQRQVAPAKLLAVIDPGERPSLAGAREEEHMLRRRFAHAEQVVLKGCAAKLREVVRHLPTATYCHFSTHGKHHRRLPQRSELHHADMPLRPEMLHGVGLDAARLVFLCACESGLAGIHRMAEEFIGLPVAFLQAGAAGVVGSLWPVFDDTALLLSSKFYCLHLNPNGSERLPPAAALREAQNWLRKLTFRKLKTMFPVRHDSNGTYLVLQGAPCAAKTEKGEQPLPHYASSLKLRLGADGERPYAAPHEWAAFTVTGV